MNEPDPRPPIDDEATVREGLAREFRAIFVLDLLLAIPPVLIGLLLS